MTRPTPRWPRPLRSSKQALPQLPNLLLDLCVGQAAILELVAQLHAFHLDAPLAIMLENACVWLAVEGGFLLYIAVVFAGPIVRDILCDVAGGAAGWRRSRVG